MKIMIVGIAHHEFVSENFQNNAIIARIKRQPHQITSFGIKAAENESEFLPESTNNKKAELAYDPIINRESSYVTATYTK